jgi:TM2 domain-containing membrane protein YozV
LCSPRFVGAQNLKTESWPIFPPEARLDAARSTIVGKIGIVVTNYPLCGPARRGPFFAGFYAPRSARMVTNNDTHSVAIGYILWIFGFTGSHRFYFGKPITGTLWFLTFGLLGIGWLIDVFLIPGMDRQADYRYRAGRLDYTAAWLMLTFLGILGIHRFYMGKIVTGLIFLFTGGLFGLGILYDFCTLNGQVSEINEREAIMG